MFAIKHDNGTYYRFMAGIGPCFGGTEEQAAKFDTREEIGRMMLRGHWAFATTEVVEVATGDAPTENK